MIKLKDLLKETTVAMGQVHSNPYASSFKSSEQIEEILINEGVDLYSHIKLVQQHLENFKKDLDRKRGGSFESDSIEYEDDRWNNNSKKLKGRDKKLGQWEKKVKKTLDSLMKDYVKAWK